MEKLKTKYEGIKLYYAGLPNFPKNFTRDSIISSILMKDTEMLKNQLIFCALKQGKKKGPITGEEPGKIHHEFPENQTYRENFSTLYNACDTTALFLIGHYFYQKLTNNKTLAEKYLENIKKSVNYILLHLNDGLFYEDPKFANAEKFALKVTYWKDSEIFGRENGNPSYPIVYTLAHIQNMAGLRSAAKLLKSDYLMEVANKMKDSIQKLYDNENKFFYLAIDKEGGITGVTSDGLHSLFYLEKGDITKEQIKEIVNSSKELETTLGYRTMSERYKMNNTYHSETIWPFEQAIINIGARKFGLKEVEEISSRISKTLEKTYAEIFIFKEDKIVEGGCKHQLWTIAAKKYFESIKQKPFKEASLSKEDKQIKETNK